MYSITWTVDTYAKKLVYNKESYIRSLVFHTECDEDWLKEQLHYTAIDQDQSTGNKGVFFCRAQEQGHKIQFTVLYVGGANGGDEAERGLQDTYTKTW